MSIREELETIKNDADVLRAEDVVEWARAHTDSALHSAIEWNDQKAAGEYRIWQVRRLIAIHIEDDQGERKFISLSVDRKLDGGGYRDITDVVLDPELNAVMLNDALGELQRIQAKYKRLRSLAKVWTEVDRVRAQVQPEAMAS